MDHSGPVKKRTRKVPPAAATPTVIVAQEGPVEVVSRSHLWTWLVVLGLTSLALWLLGDVLLPFIAGLVLAYFLDPVADWLEARGLPRVVAALVILVAAIVAMVAVLVIVVPILSAQVASFSAHVPQYTRTLIKLFDEAAPDWMKSFLVKDGATGVSPAADFAEKSISWGLTLVASLWSGGVALVNILSLLIVTPVVAFYLLIDWDPMVALVDTWLPRQYQATIRRLFSQINDSIAGFIRGQGLVCVLLAVFYSLALSLAGLNFGLLIGVVAGALTFIPFIGAMIGGGAAIGVALVQFWPDAGKIATIATIFVVGQILEGYVLSPRLVGNRIGVHPVWLMFALTVFGYLFGFVGLLLAVPLAAATGVLLRFSLEQYLQSSLYLGDDKIIQEPGRDHGEGA